MAAGPARDREQHQPKRLMLLVPIRGVRYTASYCDVWAATYSSV